MGDHGLNCVGDMIVIWLEEASKRRRAASEGHTLKLQRTRSAKNARLHFLRWRRYHQNQADQQASKR
jgi:hypothetical protein